MVFHNTLYKKGLINPGPLCLINRDLSMLHQNGTLRAGSARIWNSIEIRDNRLARWFTEYYHFVMKRTARKMLNWVVIMMMVMLPVRSVLALPLAACDMHEAASHASGDHGAHAMHHAVESVRNGTADASDCCDSATHCGGDCGMGTGFSFIAPSVISVPSSIEHGIHSRFIDHLVFREIAPPFRPPANL